MLDVRLLRSEETEIAHRILVDCFGKSHDEAARVDISATFYDYPYVPISMVALLDGKYCGFVQGVTAYFHANIYNVLWLSVLPEFRRQGFGAALILTLERYVYTERFKGKPGSFMLVSEYKQEYYEKLGYVAGLKTYDGCPVMIKNVAALDRSFSDVV